MSLTSTTRRRRVNHGSRLPGGPQSVWISRETHRRVKEYATPRGLKLQWAAEDLLKRSLEMVGH